MFRFVCIVAAITMLASTTFAQSTPPGLYGVNLAGADFGTGNVPGEFGVEYTYPTADEVAHFTAEGMTVFRLPFLWERLQPTPNSALNGAELNRIKTFVSSVLERDAWVVLDPHNSARYYGEIIGASDVQIADFVDFWTRLATEFADQPTVIFGLINEPYDMQTELWLETANAAIAGIRATGARNLILVPGNGWSGAHAWGDDYYGTANADVMGAINDPFGNFAYEVHQYLDEDSSGTAPECVSETIGAERLDFFTKWLKTNGARGFLGEFAGGRNPTCMAAVDNMLTYLDAHEDVWLGWAWWAAGPWWGDDMYTLEPEAGRRRAYLDILGAHIH